MESHQQRQLEVDDMELVEMLDGIERGGLLF
jgi:hypothetical protein